MKKILNVVVKYALLWAVVLLLVLIIGVKYNNDGNFDFLGEKISWILTPNYNKLVDLKPETRKDYEDQLIKIDAEID